MKVFIVCMFIGSIVICLGSVLMFFRLVGCGGLMFNVLMMVVVNLVGSVVFSMIMGMVGLCCCWVILRLLVVCVLINWL